MGLWLWLSLVPSDDVAIKMLTLERGTRRPTPRYLLALISLTFASLLDWDLFLLRSLLLALSISISIWRHYLGFISFLWNATPIFFLSF